MILNDSKICVFGIRDGCDGSGAKMVAQTPPPTHAGGQDDSSYTNSLKTLSLDTGDELGKLLGDCNREAGSANPNQEIP